MDISSQRVNHLEEEKENWKENKICDSRAKSPGRGNVRIVDHAEPVLQSGIRGSLVKIYFKCVLSPKEEIPQRVLAKVEKEYCRGEEGCKQKRFSR